MANIRIKRSAVGGRVPTVDQLELGELAVNTYDGKVYLKKNTNGYEQVVDLTSTGLSGSVTLQVLKTGLGLVPAQYDGSAPVTFNIDPSQINIATLESSSILGSYATTGSNLFKGHEVMTGSVFISSSVYNTFNVTVFSPDAPVFNPTPTPTVATPTPTATSTVVTPTPTSIVYTSTPTPTPTPTISPTPTPTSPAYSTYVTVYQIIGTNNYYYVLDQNNIYSGINATDIAGQCALRVGNVSLGYAQDNYSYNSGSRPTYSLTQFYDIPTQSTCYS
jgi:hypothetical protein